MHELNAILMLCCQSPYIKFTLHDGSFPNVGETVQTTVKSHSGGHADYNEAFKLNKPGDLTHTLRDTSIILTIL